MRFHDAATQELVDAAAWYEDKASGVGARFLDEVESAIAMLVKTPRIGAIWENNELPSNVEVRRFPLRLFPYLLVYSTEPAVILAVAHGSRKPGYWADRAS